MRSLPIVAGCVMGLVLGTSTFAQEDPVEDSDQPATVVIMQKPPATKLEAFEQGVGGLITRGLTRVGTLSSDDGAETNLYAVCFSNQSNVKVFGLMIELINRDTRPVRCYIDEDEIPQLLEAIAGLAKVDKNSLPMESVDAGYRTHGGIELFNRDINGGRTAMIRTTAISPLTGRVYVARARFRVARMAEIVQQLNSGREMIARLKAPMPKAE